MKRRDFLKLAPLGVVGCTGLGNIKVDLENNKTVVIYTVETVAVPIGYYAASNDLLDTSLREIYNLAVNGTLTPEGVNKIIEALNTDDPLQVLLIKRIIRLAELVGADVQDGKIIDLSGIDPELVAAIARGYVDGYDTYKISHQA